MSVEKYPGGDDYLYGLAHLSEQALFVEDWDSIGDEPIDFSKFESVQRCDELQREFEAKYHLIRYPNAMYSQERPMDLSSIRLENPFLYIPGVMPDGGDLRMTLEGNVPIPYLGIALQESMGLDDGIYRGPHLTGIVDTDMFERAAFKQLGIEKGEYTFITPFKNMKVSELHIPFLMN